jgi:hypothetical protein
MYGSLYVTGRTSAVTISRTPFRYIEKYIVAGRFLDTRIRLRTRYVMHRL